jgi:hypothetical protein
VDVTPEDLSDLKARWDAFIRALVADGKITPKAGGLCTKTGGNKTLPLRYIKVRRTPRLPRRGGALAPSSPSPSHARSFAAEPRPRWAQEFVESIPEEAPMAACRQLEEGVWLNRLLLEQDLVPPPPPPRLLSPPPAAPPITPCRVPLRRPAVPRRPLPPRRLAFAPPPLPRPSPAFPRSAFGAPSAFLGRGKRREERGKSRSVPFRSPPPHAADTVPSPG